MAQTLYSLAALAAISFLSFAALRDRTDDRGDRVERVLEAEARGVLREMMEDTENRPFDALPIRGTYTVAGAFGPRLSALPGTPLDSLIADGAVVDVDDVDGLGGVRVYRWMAEPVSGIEQPIVYDAAFEVEYVHLGASGAWEPSAVPTSAKRVTAMVDHRLASAPVSLVRIYADYR